MPVSTAPRAHPPLLKPRYQPLVIVLTAVVLGILIDRFWPLPFAAWLTLAICSLGLWGIVSISRRTSLILANILLLLAVAATTGAWRHCCWNLFDADDLSCYASHKAQPVYIEAIAVESPRALPPRAPDPMQVMAASKGTRFAVDLVTLRNGTTWQPVSGRAKLTVLGDPPDIEAGDRIRCLGQLSAPEGPHNPGTFDYAARLRSDRILCQLLAEGNECVSIVKRGSAWCLSRQLSRVRAHGNRMLKRYLNPRQTELAAAVLLGFREELDADRNEAFLTTGTIHILSISGLHVSILAGVLFLIVRLTPLPRGWAAAAVAVVTVLYTLMVDVEPPVVRATILVLAVCIAVCLYRKPLGFNSLAAAALVVLAMNPSHLFHVGAQLSFLCVAGLIWCSPQWPHGDDEETETTEEIAAKAKVKIAKTLRRLEWQNLSWPSRMASLPLQMLQKFWRSLSGVVKAGIVLWLLTLPLVLARFHIISVAAVVLNVLLWPFITVGLVSGFGVLLVGSIFPPLGNFCGWICDWNFWLLESIVNWAHRLPYSHHWFPGPADWWLCGFYGALGVGLAFPHIRPRRRWCVALLGVWIALGFGVAHWPRDRNQLDCTFISMRHGCAVFIEFPSGETMLYDAGQMGSPSTGVRTISNFLWDRGLRHLDAVVLSHPDVDHYNALPGVLEKFSVGAVYVSPAMFEKHNSTVASLRDAVDQYQVPLREVRSGDRLPTGDDCVVEALHPPRNGELAPDNANSLVLAIEYRGRRIVLPGDLETPGLNDVLAKEPRRCEVLMAPHHGSRKSNSPELAAWCKPRWVVFSGDGRWNLSEIDSTYRAVGSRTLHTCNCGAIRVQIDGEGVRVSPFVKSK